MPGAIARPSKKKRSPSEDPDDAFLRAVQRSVTWLEEHRRTVILGTIAVALLVVGAVYYVSYRSNLEDRAASEIQTIRAELASGSAADPTARLQEFVTRFGGTKAGNEARILLARLQMSNGDAGGALESVRPVLDRPADDPLGYAAATIAASAYEEQGDREQALRTLRELAAEARFPFQRREADAARARLLVESGRLEEAATIYERLAEETEGSAEELYAVRLGEVRALIRSGAEPTPAPTDVSSTSGAASGGEGPGEPTVGDTTAVGGATSSDTSGGD